MRYDAVVIGGGMAGMATGALLAHRGRRVAVLEKGNQLGGRAYTVREKGFTLNYGPHALYAGHSGIAAEIARELGQAAPAGEYPRADRAFWADGGRFGTIGTKPHQVLLSQLFSPSARLGIGPVMLALRTGNPDKVPAGMTWRDWVEKRTKNQELRRFLNALGVVNTYTRPAGALSARWLVSHFKRNAFRKDYVVYVSGGWASIYEAYADAIREGGGEIICGARVDSVEVLDGRATAVVAGGQRYEAATVVCTLPPQDAPSIAAEGSALQREMNAYAGLEDVRAVCIDLGFSRRLREQGGTFIFDIERDLYFSLHSEVTPDLAPPGKQLLHAMAYLSAEEAASERLAARRKAELETGLDRWFDGWRTAAEVERVLPNARVTGLRRTPDQIALALPLQSSSAANLYFAGDARDLPYNLTEGVLHSAKQVADAISAALPSVAAGAAEAVRAT